MREKGEVQQRGEKMEVGNIGGDEEVKIFVGRGKREITKGTV